MMSTSRLRRIGGVAALLTTIGVSSLSLSTAQAAPSPAAPYTSYSLTDVATYSHHENLGGPVASCENPGGTCTLTSGSALSTTVQVKLGMPRKDVAADLSFSLSVTSTTGVTCDIPRKLKSSEEYAAWRLGTLKLYRIRAVTHESGRVVSDKTSARLKGWQPRSGVHVICRIVAAGT